MVVYVTNFYVMSNQFQGGRNIEWLQQTREDELTQWMKNKPARTEGVEGVIVLGPVHRYISLVSGGILVWERKRISCIMCVWERSGGKRKLRKTHRFHMSSVSGFMRHHHVICVTRQTTPSQQSNISLIVPPYASAGFNCISHY